MNKKTIKLISTMILTVLISFSITASANAATCTTLKCRLQGFFGNYFQFSSSSNKPTTNKPTVNNPTINKPTDSSTSNGTSSSSSISDLQTKMLSLVNEERTGNGKSTLKWNAKLAEVAQEKALDMSKNGYFSHTSPTYGSPFQMMKSFGIKYSYAAENIAKNSSIEKAHVALMNSDGHRKNILNANYNQIGIGIVKVSSNTYIIVQMFIG